MITSLEAQDEEDTLSQSTGAYSIKLSHEQQSLTDDDLDAVKNTSNMLNHVSISYRLTANITIFIFYL